MAEDGGVRRSATSGHKPKTEPIDFSKFKNRKPKDPKDISQVGGHDRFAEEQALHGVDIPNPRSPSLDDEHDMSHNHVDASHHEDEHSQSHVSKSTPLKRSSNPNARCTGAHKVLSHEDAAEHYQQSMKSFESEACPFHQVESHAAKCEQEKKGNVQIHVNQEHKEGNKTQNSRCTGAHKVQDKNEACKHYQESMTKFQSEACSFHEVESHAAKCEQEKKGQGHLEVKQEHQQVKKQNARCTGAHKVENKTQAAEHYKSSCNEFEKAGYSFHNVESHAQSMHQSSETHTEHGSTKETQHGQNKRCSGAHKVVNKQEAAEHYKSSCHEFEKAGYSFNHVESHASSLKVDEHSESHQAKTHHTESTRTAHAEGQNKRCSGAHKVVNKQEAAEHYKSSCDEFEKAGYSFNHVENHASSLKVGERSESHQRAESHQQVEGRHQAETHHTESTRSIHAEGQNKCCSGAHKVVNKSAAAEHYRSSCEEFEKSGYKFHDVESDAEQIQKGSHIQVEQHSNSAYNSHESESHAEQIRKDGHVQVEHQSNTTHMHKASSSQLGKTQNARCSGAHKVANKQEAAAHYTQSCKEFEKAGFSFSNIESHASTISQHEQRSEYASKSTESHVRQESQHHQAHGENKHNSGAHRIENKEAAAAHYNSTMESFRSEAGEFHDVEQYASTHIKDREVFEGSHRDEERSSAMRSEESGFRSEEHEQDERLQDHEDSGREEIRSPHKHITHNVTNIATESPHYEFAADHLDSDHYRDELKKEHEEHIESRKQSLVDTSNVNAHFSGAHRVLDHAAASEHYMSSYKHTEEEDYLREVREEDSRRGREGEFDSKDFATHSETSKRIEDERRESGSRHHSSAREEDSFEASKRVEDERHEPESRSRSSAREEDTFERRRAEHSQNAHFSGAYKVRDTKAAADYYRKEHRKAEEDGFRFDREESHSTSERRMSLREEDRNAEESGSRFDREEHHRTDDRQMSLSEERHDFESSMESRETERHGSRNARFSGAYKVVNKSMAADHYSEYIREFREKYDLEHMENYLDLAALAREGQQAMESTEDDLSRHRSLGLDDERRDLRRSSSWEEKSLRASHEERGRSLSQVPDHRRGLADEFYDEKNSDLKRLASHTLEEERRCKERMEGSRRTGVHHVQDKDAARAHYLAYVRQFEDEGYSWDRIEEFVKEIVEKVEDFVEGKMAKVAGVGLHVEDFDLGKKFDILSASREHSRERGRSGRDDIRDRRGSSQGWAEIERRGSHERRSSFESKFLDDKRRSERRGSGSLSDEEGRRSRHDSHERKSSGHERREDHILGSHTLEHLKHEVKDAEHHIPGARAADHLKDRLDHDLGLEHGAHHDERDHRSSQDHQSSSSNKNSRTADGALGRRLSTNVLPLLMKSARARSRSPNPAARQTENREHERREHESDHNRSSSHHDTVDRRREEHDQRANHHEGDGLLKGLGLGDHHRSSSEDHKHEERKHEEERRMHDERNRQNHQEHHGTENMLDHLKNHDAQHPSHPGAGHNEGHHGLLSGARKDHNEDHHGLLSANRADHNEGHHGLLSADRKDHNENNHGPLSAERMGRPSPKEIFHRRQASIKSPGGRKFAGNRPAGLQLPKTVGSHERRDSPPRSSLLSPKPNSRHTGAHKVGDKEAAASHMRDAYERSGNHVPFDRLEEHAAGLGKGRDNARMSAGQPPLTHRNGPEGRTGDSRRPTPGREQEHRGQSDDRASQAGWNREEERTRPSPARQGDRPSPNMEGGGRMSQEGQAQRRESGLNRMSSQRGQAQRQNSRPQSFRPSDAAARYDESGEENEDARRHFEESNPYSPEGDSYNMGREENGDYEEGGEYDHERGEYDEEGAEYDDQHENDEYSPEDYDDQEPYSPEHSASTQRQPQNRRRPAQPSSAHFKDTLRHTGMNGPGLDALNYFAGTSSAPPEVLTMLRGLEQHVADVDWNAERGWTKEHTSAAIYLGITGLLVFAKNYLGPGVLPGAEVQGQGQRGFAAGFGAGSASAGGSVKGPSSSMARPIRGQTRAPARAQM